MSKIGASQKRQADGIIATDRAGRKSARSRAGGLPLPDSPDSARYIQI